jgi:hypothetical protein
VTAGHTPVRATGGLGATADGTGRATRASPAAAVGVVAAAAVSGDADGGGKKRVVLEVVPPPGVGEGAELDSAALLSAPGYSGYFDPLQYFKVAGGRSFHLNPWDKMLLIGESIPDGPAAGRPRLRKVGRGPVTRAHWQELFQGSI